MFFASIFIVIQCLILFSTATALQLPSTSSMETVPSERRINSSVCIAPNCNILTPTINQNLDRGYNKVLSSYQYRTAEPKFIIMHTATRGYNKNLDLFVDIQIYLRVNSTLQLYIATVLSEWGTWNDPAPPTGDVNAPGFELSDFKVDIEDAARVIELAGYPQPWADIQIYRLPMPDPFYAPGQPYYVFRMQDFSARISFTVAVGVIDRVVVKNSRYFPLGPPQSVVPSGLVGM